MPPGRSTLDDGQALGYDRLLLATGAEPRALDVPGASLDGVHYLRTLDDSDALRAAARVRRSRRRRDRLGLDRRGDRGVGAPARQRRDDDLAGSGAARARARRSTWARCSATSTVDNGVQLLLGTGVAAIEGSGAAGRVRTSDGSTVDCDLVVVGIGVQPRTALAEGAGLQVSNGVLVDGHLVTSAPEVFAAGDVANQLHPFYRERIRVEHWANALNQPPVAAKTMLGKDAVFDTLPFFFSDQFDVGMEYSGYAHDWDRVVFRGDVKGREFLAFWLKDGRVVAGMNLNVWDINEAIQGLIRSRVQVDETRLADPGVSLESLAEAGAAKAG